MTMNFQIRQFKSEPYMKLRENDVVETSLDWVSHGNFAIRSNGNYLPLESTHSKSILDAFKGCERPSGRKPFWSGVIPARGMALSEYLLEAYACNDKYVKLILSSCDKVFGHNVPHYHCQMILSVSLLEDINDAIIDYLNCRILP